MPPIPAFFGAIKARLIAAAALVGGVLLFLWRFAARNRAAGRREVIQESQERAIEHAQIRDRAEDRIGGADGDELQRMRDKWTRR